MNCGMWVCEPQQVRETVGDTPHRHKGHVGEVCTPRLIRTKRAQKPTRFPGMAPDVLARLHLA